ncbi:MAG TPA: glycosyltransferase [Terriglobia bacterium]|nr:glycosyltransferase [Terriglobia bacterium]
MSYEDAFEALKNGDFPTAVPLLEKAARETNYTSDIVNHAYTLALHHTGDKPCLADVAFRVANSLLEHDPASAMDYFQRALVAGLEAQRIRRIGEIFETWAVPPGVQVRREAVDRVAHVVGCLLSGQPPTQYVKMLVSSLKLQGIASTIFTTEWAASWFFNPAGVPQSQDMPIDADVKIASVEGDFIERATKIAQVIHASGIKVAFFHGSLTEQITARVAAMRPAPIQINVNHSGEMDADLFDGRVHLFQNALKRTRFPSPSEWIPLASDIEARLKMSEPVTRQSMGLESAGTVSATFGNLYKVAGRGYLRVLSEIMQRFPKHFHIFAGAGNVKAVRSHLHSEGVLPRIRFLGHIADVAPLLGTIDVYLASFPNSGGHSILEAMGAGKPVVVLKFPADSQYNSGAELVGVRELIAPGEADYIEIADRLLRSSDFRAAQGRAMLDRFRAEFRPERLGEHYKAFIEKP